MKLFSQSTACALIAVANVTAAATATASADASASANSSGYATSSATANAFGNGLNSPRINWQNGQREQIIIPPPAVNYQGQEKKWMVSSNPPSLTVPGAQKPYTSNYRSRCSSCETFNQSSYVKPNKVCEDETICTQVSGGAKQCRTETKCRYEENSSGTSSYVKSNKVKMCSPVMSCKGSAQNPDCKTETICSYEEVPTSTEWLNQKFGTSVQPGQKFYYQEWTSQPTIHQTGFTQTGTQYFSQGGTQFGTQLGTQVGTQVGNQFGSQLGSQLGTQFGSQNGYQFGNQFGTQYFPTNTNSASANAHANANAYRNSNGGATANAHATSSSTGGGSAWSSSSASAQSIPSSSFLLGKK